MPTDPDKIASLLADVYEVMEDDLKKDSRITGLATKNFIQAIRSLRQQGIELDTAELIISLIRNNKIAHVIFEDCPYDDY